MLLPINLNVAGRPCLVVGGGPVALRKARTLAEAGARVRMVSPEFAGDDPAVERIERAYREGDLEGAWLAIAATDDPEVNRRVAAEARDRRIPILRADAPDESDFTLPATLRRGDFTVSFSTGGADPALSAALKREAAVRYGPAYDELCRLARERRRRGDPPPASAAAGQGRAFLVGAGPGDPDLLTLKGAACLAAADTVLYDAMTDPALLETHCPGARLIDVSKRKGACRKRQEEILGIMIEEARAGRRVVRLKGGDPMVFGRGGEEARALKKAGVAFEIVPGVSSAFAVPAYAGIPLTDREYSSSVGIYSAHRKGGGGLGDEEWRRIAAGGPQTLIFLMGVSRGDEIVEKLTAYGRPASTPVAVIYSGTTPRQRRIVGTLDSILPKMKDVGDAGPGLIVVGEVVRAIPGMDWYEVRAT